MKITKKRVIVVITAFLLLLPIVSATYVFNVTSCSTSIVQSGNYTLINNLDATGDCLNISTHTINLDCNFYNITGSGTGIGISINNKVEIEIKNCYISNFV